MPKRDPLNIIKQSLNKTFNYQDKNIKYNTRQHTQDELVLEYQFSLTTNIDNTSLDQTVDSITKHILTK